MKNKKNTFASLIALLLVSVFTLLTLSACGKAAEPTDDAPDVVHVSNVFIPCDTLAEAERLAGFNMLIPEGASYIEAWKDTMIQVFYGDEDDDMLIRKERGNEDISGDYNVYEQIITVDGVTLKGADDTFSLAIWSKDGFSYSLSLKDALSQADIMKLVALVG